MLTNYQNLQKYLNIQFTDKADVMIIMDQNYVQYYKSAPGCHEGQWLPAGFDQGQSRAIQPGPVPPHSTQEGSQRASCGPQLQASGMFMGMGTGQRQGRTSAYREFNFCLQVLSCLFIPKFVTFLPAFSNVIPHLDFSTGFINFL